MVQESKKLPQKCLNIQFWLKNKLKANDITLH